MCTSPHPTPGPIPPSDPKPRDWPNLVGSEPIHIHQIGPVSGVRAGPDSVRLVTTKTRLSGRVAWVADGTTELGRAIAARLTAEGARVAATAPADLTDAIAATHSRLVAEHGPIDLLINNVAADPAPVDVTGLADDELDRVMQLNFHTAVRCTRLVLPHLIETGQGAVVNVAGPLAIQPWPRTSAVAAAQGALLAWTRAAAAEVAPVGVRVNAIVPWQPGPQGALHMLPTPGTADDVAAAIAFLVSEDASFVTAATLYAEAGQLGIGVA